VLQLGIQNDGFEEIMIGHMEGSFFSIMASRLCPSPASSR
jgi:hypothetical protein